MTDATVPGDATDSGRAADAGDESRPEACDAPAGDGSGSGRSTVDLFGVVHTDRAAKVESELAPFAEGADAIFVEYPAEPFTARTYLRALARAPAFLVGTLTLQVLVFAPLYVLLSRALEPSEMVAARSVRGDRPLHRVDDNPLSLVEDAAAWTTVWNWGLIAAVAWVSPVRTAATAAVVVAGSLLPAFAYRDGHRRVGIALAATAVAVALGALFGGWLSPLLLGAGYAGHLAVLLGTLERRNEVMAERVAEGCAAAGHDRVVLVTGRAHLRGLVRLLDAAGLDVGRLHRSKWLRRSDDQRSAPDPDEVSPVAAGRLSGHPDGVPGTEGDVVGWRVLAGLVDVVILAALAFVLGVAGGLLAATFLGEAATRDGIVWGMAAGVVGYYPVLEAAFGRTVGKRLAGLVVVDLDGGQCSSLAAVLRNVLRPVDMLGPGVVALLVTSRHTRFGDLLAGTAVVRAEA